MTVRRHKHTTLSDNNFMRRRINSELSDVKKKMAVAREAALLEESISKQLERVEQAYMQIGQAYMQKHPKDYDEDYLPYVKEILDAKEFIDAFKEKLRKIKGLQICPHCGQEIVIDAKFCNYCGARLDTKEEKPAQTPQDQPDPRSVRICPVCLEIIPIEESFCPHCGSDLQQPFDNQSRISILKTDSETEAEGTSDLSSETPKSDLDSVQSEKPVKE